MLRLFNTRSLVVPGACTLLAGAFLCRCDSPSAPPTTPGISAPAGLSAQGEHHPGDSPPPPTTAAQTPLTRDKMVAVNMARGLEDTYGTQWREVVQVWREVWKLRQESHLLLRTDALTNNQDLDRWKQLLPPPSAEQRRMRATVARTKWEELRERIRRRARTPVPPSHDELARLSPEERASASIAAAKRILGSVSTEARTTYGYGRKRISVFATLAVGFSQLVIHQNSCSVDCQRQADELIALLYEICVSAYHTCCDDIGPCYANSDARRICIAEYDDCIEAAEETYVEWYQRCADRC